MQEGIYRNNKILEELSILTTSQPNYIAIHTFVVQSTKTAFAFGLKAINIVSSFCAVFLLCCMNFQHFITKIF